jgi:GWxTD domain-containing protein
MRVGWMLIGSCVLAMTVALGQPRGGSAMAGPHGEQGAGFFFFDAIALPLPGDSSHVRVDVHYRIDREFFIPVKNDENGVPEPFHRRGELLVELLDSTGTPGGRALERIEIGDASSERRPAGHEWRLGTLSITVSPGTYRIVLSVDDLESKRNHTDNAHFLTVAQGRTGIEGVELFYGLPVRADSALPAFLHLMNYGSDILFGRPSTLVAVWRTQAADDSVLGAKISFAAVPPAEEDLDRLPGAVTAHSRIFRNVALTPAADGSGYALAPGGSASVTFIPFPSDKLLLRNYTATISLSTGGTRTKEITRQSRTVWPDMPFSLKDIDYALDALRYITTEALLDSLKSGNTENRRKNLELFWQGHSRNPGSVFNDVETEYYRRVDYAIRNFGTLRAPDGFRSDRGKIYILYGPPTRTDRSLDPAAGYQEIWVYEKLRKEFRFVDVNKSGTYVLVTKPQ